MKSKKIFFLIISLMILSLGLTACAAQDEIPGVSALQKDDLISVTMDQLELGETFFVGKVTEVAANAVSIENVVFRIDRNSAVPSGLTVGDVVAVNGLLLPDQTRYAASMQMRSVANVSLDDSQSGLEFKLYGIVETMEVLLWTVSGETIHISENALVEDGIQVGNIVEVEGYLVNGALRAIKIQKEEPVSNVVSAYPAPTSTVQPSIGQEVEFFGTIETMQIDKWVVDGKQVQITTQTEIKGILSLGDIVKVHAVQLTDGSLLAREIKLAASDGTQSASSGENEVEFKGYVEQILNGSWLVSGVVVLVSTNTSLESNIQVGNYVEVKGQQLSDGSVAALRIELESSDASSSGDDDEDDSSGNSGDDDVDDDNSGSSGGDDDGEDDDNSGSGGGDDDGEDDDNSGSGGGDDDGEDDDNSGSSGGDDDGEDDDNSGSSGGDDDGEDDDNSGSGDGDDEEKEGDD